MRNSHSERRTTAHGWVGGPTGAQQRRAGGGSGAITAGPPPPVTRGPLTEAEAEAQGRGRGRGHEPAVRGMPLPASAKGMAHGRLPEAVGEVFPALAGRGPHQR